MVEARYYTKEKELVTCILCPHNCIIKEGRSGICGARYNNGKILVSENYGMVSALKSDPVEKKPLYHFCPGMDILSVGSYGCNMKCRFCQNHHISQFCFDRHTAPMQPVSPAEIVGKAISAPNNAGLAFTYNEPVVWFEYMLDIARLAKEHNLKTAMITNAYINAEPLSELIGFIDAFNIDLKAFDDNFYRQQTGARLADVLSSIKTVTRSRKHLELTMLVIPGLNDNEDSFREMMQWIKDNCNNNTVLHLSRYFPNYKSDQAVTPDKMLLEMYNTALSYIGNVYLGNTSLATGRNTWCPSCNKLLIERKGYTISIPGINKEKRCNSCGADLAAYITFL